MVSPLEEALRTISRQTEKEKVRAILANVHAGHRRRPAAGRSACGASEASFPPLYRAMVAAGENSGSLPSIAERLADSCLKRQAEIRGKIIAALAYPIVLALVAMAVVAALMVVGRAAESSNSSTMSAQQLPLLTRIVIALSRIPRGLVVGAARCLIALGVWVSWRALKSRRSSCASIRCCCGCRSSVG